MRHKWAVANAQRQGWVPVSEREAEFFVGRTWSCTCPSFLSEINQSRVLKRCKHIDAIHDDLRGTPVEKRERRFKALYVDDSQPITLEAQFYGLLGSHGERYLVSWMANGDDAEEHEQERQERLRQLHPAATAEADIHAHDDW